MKKISVFYDNWCPNCRKFAGVIKKIDWLKLIFFEKLRDENQTSKYKDINIELAKQQMASYTDEWHYGYESLYLIFTRVPFFWVCFPLFWILKVTGLGQFAYLELAVKRKILPLHCSSEICEI